MSTQSLMTNPPPTDEALAEFLKTGSEQAFEAFVIRYSPLVLGVCRRMLRADEADDAAQAVFVLLWQKAKQISSDAVIAGWLHRTAHHLCRNAIRLRHSRTRHEEQAARGASKMRHDTDDAARWNEIRQILDQEVNSLPDKLRVPFVLFHFESRSLPRSRRFSSQRFRQWEHGCIVDALNWLNVCNGAVSRLVPRRL